MPEKIEEALKLKEKGNVSFKEGDWQNALSCYTEALSLTSDDSLDKAVLYKNRAAVHLKVSDYEKTIDDCTKALEICPNDVKALFRRCQALDKLERFEEAYKDARAVHNLEPKNQMIQSILERLQKYVHDLVEMKSKTSHKVQSMFEFTFNKNSELEKRKTSVSNLLVLAKERAGADLMVEKNIISNIVSLLKTEECIDVRLNCIRIIGELCKSNLERTKSILKEVGVPWILDNLNSNEDSIVTAAQYVIQTILNTLAGMNIKDGIKPDKALLQNNCIEIDSIMSVLLVSITSRTLTGIARDSVIDITTQNIDYTTLCWAEKFVEKGGVGRLLDVASEIPEYKYESSIEVTESTSALVSMCLSKIYDNMYHDIIRDNFIKHIEDYVNDKLQGPDIEDKVRVTAAITTMLKGPLDVGNTMVGKQGVLEMMLAMAQTEDELQQRIAAEALIAATTKKDKASSVINLGANILKELYKSKSEAIKVRALVGLCKLGSSAGTDGSRRPFAEGSTLKLAEACRRFLINPRKDRSIRKWSVEGLSYLTLDAEVKEKLIEDKAALKSLIEVAKSDDKSVVYGSVATLVNLTNSYDKQEIIPEMVELAKFAKQHIPEEHELDDPDFVDKRVSVLAKEGVTVALVALAKTESKNCRELISRVFNAICQYNNLRGLVVQQGGVKALIGMALDGTDKGKLQASHALARIGISINPEQAFPGQRAMEVIRPINTLLHVECSALENFEALLALGNLAGMSESVRQKMISEQIVSRVEHYMFEDHEFLKRAAVQCTVNLVMSPDTVKMYEGKNDRVKLLVLFSMEEDFETAKAASGALAIVTNSKRCCQKVLEVNSWLEALRYLLANENVDLQHRGSCIIANMMSSCKEVAEALIKTEIMELLMMVSRLELEDRKAVVNLSKSALKSAEEWELIKPNTGDQEEIDSDVD